MPQKAKALNFKRLEKPLRLVCKKEKEKVRRQFEVAEDNL